MPRQYEFVWVDVFARTALEGNQLAVFPNAHGLGDEQMQLIARETHLSETTFVFPKDEAADREHGFATRIFAVAGEMPFAGHPTLGTASVLSQAKGWTEVALSLRVGRIPVRFTDREGRTFGEMVQNDPTFGQIHDPKEVARVLRVATDELDADHPIQTVSTGVPFAIVPFRALATLSRLRPDTTAMEAYLKGTDAQYLYLVSRETAERSASLHARMIFSGGEDPATGSAAGPATAWMVRHGWARPNQEVRIEQGVEANRPSQIFARVDLQDGRPVDVRVGGHVVPVIRGQLSI